MNDRETILNLLNKFSREQEHISWNMICCYSDGIDVAINQINIIDVAKMRVIGIITYRVDTGEVYFCMYKKLKKSPSDTIIDVLLDLMNYDKRYGKKEEDELI